VGELRVATVFGEGSDIVPIASDVRANLDSFAARVADAGARVDAVALPVPLAEGFSSWRDLGLPIIGLGLPDKEYAQLASLENVPGDDLALVTAKAMTSRFRSWMPATEASTGQACRWVSRWSGRSCRTCGCCGLPRSWTPRSAAASSRHRPAN
jgi:hypothetical protein